MMNVMLMVSFRIFRARNWMCGRNFEILCFTQQKRQGTDAHRIRNVRTNNVERMEKILHRYIYMFCMGVKLGL